MHILVVDDDADFRLFATRAFESRGHKVECLPSAFGLVNRVAVSGEQRIDVVVLDCDLPGLSGVSALELLARDRRTSSTPVLLVSAGAGVIYDDAASKHGRAWFFQKDGRLKSLVDALDRVALSSRGPASAQG
jgi:DNA-binding response OmpR family regulator